MTSRFFAWVAVLLVGLTGSANAASCNDACLRRQLDAYLDGLKTQNYAKLRLAKTARYTENGRELKMGAGLWERPVSFADYSHYFVDSVSGQAMFYGAAQQGEPLLLTIRLGIKDNAIAEIEHIVARKGSHALFAPEALPKPNPMLATDVPKANRLTRNELVAVADSYLEGIEQHNSKIIKADENCQRIENGVQTTNQPGRGSRNCQHSADLLTYIEHVSERRFPIVDVNKGVVISTFIFEIPGEKSAANDANISANAQVAARLREPRTLLLTEWFKIDHGKIEHIEAIMHNLPYGSKSGW